METQDNANTSNGAQVSATDMDGASGDAGKKPRNKLATKKFVLRDGTESAHANAAAVALRFKLANGATFETALGNYPEHIQTCLAWNGLAQKLGDTYAGAPNAAAAAEDLQSLHEQLVGGEWSQNREGVGPTPSLVIEAVCRALIASGRGPVNDARRAAITAKLNNKEARAAALKDKAIALAYEEIKAERAAERLAKMRAEAAALSPAAADGNEPPAGGLADF